jgi:co-chaperonin GroES (HSP10)
MDKEKICQKDIDREYPKPGRWNTSVSLPSYKDGQDPRQVLFDLLKDALPLIEPPYGKRVLVATAPHRDRSAGGILYTDKRKDEGRYQGKVGLVLMIGPTAFKYDGQYDWEGPRPIIGDWVYYRPSDAFETGINGVPCRFVNDDLILGRVSDPEVIF